MEPAVSRSGDTVAFASDASNLVDDDPNKQRDVFVFDRANGRPEPVSTGTRGPGNGPSENPAVSFDGNRIAFESRASNLVEGFAPKFQTVYVRDRETGSMEVAAAGPGGGPAIGDSGQAGISGDGQVVAFVSEASDLITSRDNALLASLREERGGAFEVYAHDLLTKQTILVSDVGGGTPGGSQSLRPAIDGNGRRIAFESTSDLLVPDDTNQLRDVFLRDLPPVPTLNPAVLDFGTRAIGEGGAPLAATLTNGGWGLLTTGTVETSGAAEDDFSVVNGCAGRALRLTESCTVTVVFTPAAEGDRRGVLDVGHDGPDASSQTALRGVGSEAVLKIDPPIARPGTVVIATGAGFPGDTLVTLAWSRGVRPNVPIMTSGDGGFRVQVLVFHNDIVGRRDLIATLVGSAASRSLRAPFLVVEASGEPPRFIVQSPYDDRPPTLVMRR
jgi:hypothetical protein